jgi:hypothetical protein
MSRGVWRFSRNFHDQPRACFRSALLSWHSNRSYCVRSEARMGTVILASRKKMHGSIAHEPRSNGPDSRHDLLQWLAAIGWSGAARGDDAQPRHAARLSSS